MIHMIDSASGRPSAVARWVFLLVAAAVGLALSPAVRAQENPIKVRAVPQFAEVPAGGRLVIAVEMIHSGKFHTWPAAEVKLPDDVDEVAIRTEIGPVLDEKQTDALREAAEKAKKSAAQVAAIRAYTLPAWISRFDGAQYPVAHDGKVADPSGVNPTITVPLYSDKAVTFLRFEISPTAPAGEQTIDIAVHYQSCDDRTCLMPQDLVIPVKVKVLASGAKEAKPADAALFAAFDAKKWGSGVGSAPVAKPGPSSEPKKSDVPTAPAPKGASSGGSSGGVGNPSIAPAAATSSFLGFQLGSGILVLFAFSVLGGFVLNLTPCVLPVIPIKVMTITQHALSHHRAVMLGVWMALGVITFWVAIGVPMALISSKIDPSRYIFGVWWVTLGIGLIIAAMGFGIMGLFNITLPQTVYMISPKADTPYGSFVFGVMTAVLGLPCFGFVAGGLLAGAATLPPFTILAIFLGLGIGMAAPYLVLSVWPQLLKFIPRTGPASELVKQVMGLLLLAAAAFFASAGIKGLLSEKPYLAGSIAWWAVAFFILLASLWMVVRTWQITRKPVARLAVPALAVLMVGAAVVFANGLVGTAREDWLRERAAAMSHDGGTLVTGAWVEYTPERLEKALAAKKTVVVDFTADWCINCKFLKRTVLDVDPVRAILKTDNVVLLEVDLTAKSAPGWAYLAELGQTGIPTLAIYGPAIDRPVLLNAYTSDTVVTALNKAASTPTAGAVAKNDAKAP